jgi:protein-L-isoaspartate(D-aspartate) O-methyltransferase
MEYIRKEMVEALHRKGVVSGSVLNAVYRVPRHLFVSEALRYSAYRDTSLPIGFGQTISKPSVIAMMVQALHLTGEERVLEIGTGSGYQTAILSQLAGSVVTMERIRELAVRAHGALSSFSLDNVTVLHGDDFRATEGTFDAIIVAAGAEIFPVDLCDKMNAGGRLVIPVGDSSGHRIMKYVRKNDGSLIEENIGHATFVPYIAAR